jgi:AraC family ethanolamine operon transcriptional activator
LRALQLEPGPFDARVDILSLEQVTIRRVATLQPLACRIQVPADSIAFICPQSDSSPLLWRRHSLCAGECLVLAGGSEAEIVTKARHSHISVTCRLKDLRRYAPLSASRPGQALLSAVEALFDRASTASLSLHGPQSLDDVEVLAAMASVDLSDTGVDSAVTSSVRRFSAVRKARAFIHANLTATLRLSDICRHAHAQARTLEYGFRETLGITPIAYLKVLRLHRAQRRLLEAEADASITQIALECGFGHLSQFAMDYRHQFGERPSETRRRVLGLAAPITRAAAIHGFQAAT